MSNLRVIHPSSASLTPEQARDARARAWKFIFDTHREKAAGQDNAKSKQESLNTEEGGPHDLEEDSFVRQKV
jgi:hypothetical protein